MDKFGGSRLFYYFTAEYAALERCLNKTKTATMRLSTEAMVSISEGKPSCGYTLSFASVLASFSWR